MIKFEYLDSINESGDKVSMEFEELDELNNIITGFTKFLKSIGFNENLIIDMFKEEIISIKDNIKETFTMMDD